MAVRLSTTARRAWMGKLVQEATINIVSSTNASPTVMTVTAHGLSNGDVIVAANHATNTNANGARVVGGVTANTFTMTDLNTGAAVNGNGVGGATGTIARVAIGLYPEDLGDMVRELEGRSFVRGSDANRSASSTVKTILGA